MEKYILYILLFFSCTGCFRQNNTQDVVIVEVNKARLTAGLFAQKLSHKLKGLNVLQLKEAQNITRIKDQVIDEFIHEVIVIKWAEQNHLIVSEKDIQQRIQQIKQSYPDDISFRKSLVEADQTLNDFKKNLHIRLLEEKVFQIIRQQRVTLPTLDDLKAHYATHKSSFNKKARVYLQQLLFENKSDAHTIYQEIKKQRKDIEMIVESSMTPLQHSKIWIEKGTFDVFENAFFMQKGVWSNILQSPYGYHIYRVLDRKAKRLSTFEEVKGIIQNNLIAIQGQKVYTRWLKEQMNQIQVYRNEQAIADIKVEH